MKLSIFTLLLLCSIIAEAQLNQYSWGKQQAKVLPNGDLEWAPEEFKLDKGNSVRYIDFKNGSDSNDGQSTDTPWKHHPWDNAATGNAKNSTGIHTYIFKRGVVYRGSLTAKQSGTADNPVRLTSDPEWGTGEAQIYGSVGITDGWQKVNSETVPDIPNPEMVWYKNIGALENETKVVCEVTDSAIKRVYLARSPNYINTPEEPMKTWWSFTGKNEVSGDLNLTDVNHLVQSNPDFYKGGDVWAIEDAIVMCTLWKQEIENYSPSAKTITVNNTNFGGKDCKYYVENTPFLLNSPGEYYYDKAAGRIYIRLHGDKDPNTTTIEVASKSQLLKIDSKSNIEISGLTFGFTTYDKVRYGYNDGVPTIALTNCSNIEIRNCKFHYLNGGILAKGSGKNFIISDNEMNYMDDFAIFFYGPDQVSILRNKIFENGTRHLGRWYGSIPAIAGNMSVGEIAGNIVEHSWGSGINITWGKGGSDDANVPFIRGFVHHNRVSHSLQGVNDYGGIEAWGGGPVYTYNNISEDAQGWHYNWGNERVSLGYAIYHDGSFKNYIFNNIVKGTGWNLNSGAYMHVLGFYNMWVHNVAYNVSELTFSGDGNLSPDGQNYYLGNVSDSTELQFYHATRRSGIPFESLGNNVFSGNEFKGTFITNRPTSGRSKLSFTAFTGLLNSFTPDLGTVGFESSKRVFTNPAGNDFRPTETSEVIDQGVKFFAPFPLSKVVGEWHFNKHQADSTLIKGENFYFTSEFNDRLTYKNVPKNHLTAAGLSDTSFVYGELEDWAPGALYFDGIQTYCMLDNDETSATVCNDVDMATNGFILESYFKTPKGHTGGALIAKYGDSGYGYQLDLDDSGSAQFSAMNNGAVEFSQSGSTAVNDGEWHHVLVEVNRQTANVNVYIDGVLANGETSGIMPAASVSFANTNDLLIGKNKDDNYFYGTVDFMRISKGTLADAKTDIDELYTWEFDGPFLYDFAGNEPIGKRDAGALEKGGKICDMSVSEEPVYFGLDGGTKTISVNADEGFEVTKKDGFFFNYSVEGNTVDITTQSLIGGSREGAIYIYGCNETRKIPIVQLLATDVDDIEKNGISVMPNPVHDQRITITVPHHIVSGQVKIMNMNGQLIQRETLELQVSAIKLNIPAGVYLLSISGEKTNYTTKLVVK